MVEKIHQWCGFSVVHYKKKEGDREFEVVWTIRGIIRSTAEEAWEDALEFERQQEVHLKNEGLDSRRIDIRSGICPPEFLY